MRKLMTLLILLAASLATAAPAQACLGYEKIYPGFWSAAPSQLRAGEVALKVRLIAFTTPDTSGVPTFSQGDPEPGRPVKVVLWTSCSGATYIFETVEVVAGKFNAAEIAVTLPRIGQFRNSLYVGDTVLVVGRPIGDLPVGSRWTDNARETYGVLEQRLGPYRTWSMADHEEAFKALDDIPYSETEIPGPATVTAFAYRPPVLERILAMDWFGPEYICDPLLNVLGLKCPD